MNIPRPPSVSTAVLAVLFAGCGGDDAPTFSIRIHAPPPITADGLCPPAGNFVPPTLSVGDSVRVTYRDPVSRGILCDAVLPFDQPTARLGVPFAPDGGTAPVLADVIVEIFHTDAAMLVTLTSSGETRNVRLGDPGEIPVFVAPRQDFACAAGPQQIARGFHSATLLPNGEVLLVGGIVAHPGPTEIPLIQPTGNFYVSETAEIYDPRRGTFRELPVTDLVPRVFHQAYLLTPAEGATTWDVLLVGGLTVTGPASSTPVVDGVRDANEPLRMVPAPGSEPAPPEILSYDPATGTAGRRALVDDTLFGRRAFPAVSTQPSEWDKVTQRPPLVAGGWTSYTAGMPPVVVGSNSLEIVDLTDGDRLGVTTAFMPDITRAGATITLIGGNRALLWGGNIQSPTMSEETEAGHVITGVGTGTPGMAGVMFDPMVVNAHPRAFHSAVALAPDRVLMVGGFRVQAGSAFEPTIPFAYTVNVDPLTPAITTTTIAAVADAVPAGYLAALPILDGTVLITGGTPDTPFICPESTVSTYLCALPDAYVFHEVAPGMETIDSLPDMIVPRWGHRMVALLDGTVLVTGGLRLDTDRLMVVADAELFNPRTELLDPVADDPAIVAGTYTRTPGNVAQAMDGTPARPCFIGTP